MARALAELAAGRPVLVADDAGRENEVDVVLAAGVATQQWVAWTVRHSSGYLCAPMPAHRADALELPLMVERTEDPLRTAYTVSVDAVGVSTGISAADRALTMRVLGDPASVAGDLIRPGHVLPLRARPGGVLERPGHTEAAVDLVRLAG
ncbi:3,4-dihydroxy-2-butanone-4-phosphate synthase, partial [Promicromonospora kroppenstedtii]|uniref:3,4-dihydroxy-2-butanone-4-phosphate synthase n=1 Tax=Promicromonospora kroppenstedtii TaxID=440482 RepID=UPI00056C1361